jgi:hypothetical protein
MERPKFVRIVLILAATAFGADRPLKAQSSDAEVQVLFDEPDPSFALGNADTSANEPTTPMADQKDPAAAPVETTKPAPVAKPKPKPAPKKKAPPVFPGPKVLPPTGPYKPLYFDNDFSNKGKPGEPYVFGEEAKLMKFEFLDVDCVFSTGGEIRHRYLDQDNRLQPGGPGRSTYDQLRWRHYFDLKAGDNLRFYVESIFADSYGEDLPAQAIDVNRWDFLNAFVDVKLFDTETGGTQTLRYGKQELLFGRQRLVSPLDWANTRRNFEGFRYLVKEKDWKMDLFAVNPLNSATGFRSVTQFDNQLDKANRDVWFSGTYFTYTAIENTNIDLYWMWLDDSEPTAGRADGNRHTFGARLAKLFPVDDASVWDLDIEGGYQFGRDFGQDVQAGFATAILGHTWKKLPWTPRISGLAYYGSGDNDPTDDENNTFCVMFPLGHAYWAISDNLSGQNLIDLCAQAEVKPTAKTALVSAWHHFQLASGDDVLYNVAGAPVGTPGNGRDVGQALDLYGYYAMNANLDLQLGYSWFWYGEFIDRTTPRGDCTQFYVQTSVRY